MPTAFQLLLALITKQTENDQDNSANEPTQENQSEQTKDQSKDTQEDVPAEAEMEQSDTHEVSEDDQDGLDLDEDTIVPEISAEEIADPSESHEVGDSVPIVVETVRTEPEDSDTQIGVAEADVSEENASLAESHTRDVAEDDEDDVDEDTLPPDVSAEESTEGSESQEAEDPDLIVAKATETVSEDSDTPGGVIEEDQVADDSDEDTPIGETEAQAEASDVTSEESETTVPIAPEPPAEAEVPVVEAELESATSDQDTAHETIETPLGLGVIDEVYHFIAMFDNSQIHNVEQASVNNQDSAGGITKPAIFEQPRAEADARIEYELSLPQVESDEKLVLHFSTGLRDGIDFDYPLTKPDGVRFAIDISGERHFEGTSVACEWEEHVVDISEFAGKETQVVFVTACNGRRNIDYDWALWGNPRILKLTRTSLLVEKGETEAKVIHGLAVGTFNKITEIQSEETSEGGETSEPNAELSTIEFTYDAPTTVSEIADEISQRMVADAETRGHLIELPSEKFELALYTELPKPELVTLGSTTAIATAGEDFEVQCTLRNNGAVALTPINQASVAINRIKLRRGRNTYPIKTLDAGAETKLVWNVRRFSRESVAQVSISLKYQTPMGEMRQTLETAIDIRPIMPKLSPQTVSELHTYNLQEHVVTENKNLRLLFVQGTRGFEYYTLFAGRRGSYRQVATCHAISEVRYRDSKGEPQHLRILPTTYRLAGNSSGDSIVILASEQQDGDGVRWSYEARFSLAENDKRVRTEYSLVTDGQRELLAFNGPVLHAGDGSYGEGKTTALFPGLEFLESDEPSSDTRDVAPPHNNRLVPHPYKITMPVMAVEYKKSLVGLAWNPSETWDGEHTMLSAVFASPNWHENQQNHLMGLFVPALPDWVEENCLEASTPYTLEANRQLTINAQIIVDGNGTTADAISHWTDAYGVPEPLEPPRSDEDELALSRHGFMHTVWDEGSGKSQHCVGWAPANVPGIATLLWYDYLATQDDAVKQRVVAIAESTIRESGPGGLTSPSTCQILKWEFPFYFGHVEAGLERLKEMTQGLIETQEDDGSWCYRPITENAKRLGEDGDIVLGTCAHSALMLLKHARIVRDEESLNAGVKALKAMDRFNVPRGAQASECPLNTPDLLAAAHAVGAYVEAYEITNEKHHLERAEYWAKTGLAFLYHWNLSNRPAMRFASVPVFGATSYTHPWFGVPAQWSGLVFAYYLQHFARHSRKHDWTNIAEGITVSGMHQQWTEGEFKGTYPDALHEFCTDGRAPHINPENIMVNLYTLRGQDPDISTAIIHHENGRVHLSSGAKIETGNSSDDGRLDFKLSYVENETSHTIITGCGSSPATVKALDKDLPSVENLDEAESGWLYREEKDIVFIKYKHASSKTNFEVLSPPKEELRQVEENIQQEETQEETPPPDASE